MTSPGDETSSEAAGETSKAPESTASLVQAIEDRLGIRSSDSADATDSAVTDDTDSSTDSTDSKVGIDESEVLESVASRGSDEAAELAPPQFPGPEHALRGSESSTLFPDGGTTSSHSSPTIDATPVTESIDLRDGDPTTRLATESSDATTTIRSATDAARVTGVTGAADGIDVADVADGIDVTDVTDATDVAGVGTAATAGTAAAVGAAATTRSMATARKPRATTQRPRAERTQPILAPVAQPRSPQTTSKRGFFSAVLAPLGAAGLALLVWWIVTRGGDPIVSSTSWPSPGDTWDAFQDLRSEQSYSDAIVATSIRLGIALAGGIVAGLGIGWILGRFRTVRNLLRPLTSGLRLLAPPLLIPFLLIWFGTGPEAVWLPAFVGVVASVMWSMSNTIDDRQRNLAFNIAERAILALRNGAMVAWPLIYIGEMLGSEEGVANSLLASAEQVDLPQAVVWLGTALVLAVVVDIVLRFVQFLLARPARRELV